MPYKLRKKGAEVCVLDSAGATVGCHPTRREALRHMRALYANVGDAVTYKAANYSARAGQVIAGNLARGGDGKFTAAGNASSSKKKIKPSFGASRLAKPTPKKAAPKGKGKGKSAPKGKTAAKPKAAAGVKPKSPEQQELARLRVESARERMADQRQRRAERAKAGIQREIDKAKREVDQAKAAGDRKARQAERDQERKDRISERRQQLAERAAERAQKRLDADAKKAEKKPAGGGGKGATATTDKAKQRAANRAKVGESSGVDPAAFGTLMNMADGAEDGDPAALEALRRAGLAERDTSGQYRISEAGRAFVNAANSGDTGRARDAASRARDRVAKRTDRATKIRRRSAGVRLKEDSPPVKKPVRAPDRVLESGHSGVVIMFNLPAAAAEAIAAVDGVTESAADLHITLCYLGDSAETALATNKGRILEALEIWAATRWPLAGTINGMGRFFTAEKDNTNAVYVSPDLPMLPDFRQALTELINQTGIEYPQDHGYTPHVTISYVPVDDPTPDLRFEPIPLELEHVTLAWGDEHYDIPIGLVTEKALFLSPFAVFKDYTGGQRWVMVSSVATRDRAGETVTTEALKEDCEYADQTGNYGPLRLWHIKNLDIGDCDFNMVVGHSLIESGTFRYKEFGEAIAKQPELWQSSIGFYHPLDQPCQNGIFTRIRRFERSLLPAGMAANPFTRLAVKEDDMTKLSVSEKIEALKVKLGAGGEGLLDTLLANVAATEKAAEAQGMTFKEAISAGVGRLKEDDDGDGMEDQPEAADDQPESGGDETVIPAEEMDMIAELAASKIRAWLEPLIGATKAAPAAADPPAAQAPPSAAPPTADPPAAQVADKYAALLEQFTAMGKRVKGLEEEIAEDVPAGAKGFRPSRAASNVTTKEAAPGHTPKGDPEIEKAVDFILNGQ
jgi:2'-5' RNA ligase